MTPNELFDLHILFALVGGAVGASKAFFKQKDDSTGEKVVNFAVGCVTAVSLSDVSLRGYDLSVYGYLGVGMIWGLIGMYLVEAVQNVAPTIFKGAIKKKIKDWLGVDPDDKGE